MPSISKLQASLAAATNEVTVVAANINFDFTLVKYEAPKEYEPLGSLLSATRKQNAELGTIHVTARRLGALFEGICPPTPNLVRAYGERVSEISKAVDNKASSDYSKSIFSAYTGIDGISIWAAATSSKAALHVHLLSCMLARFWESLEAISVWVELINERKKEIATKLENGESLPFSLAAAAAGQLEISRPQLAEWDTSARAWLQSADVIETREHTQLKLLLKNIDLPINQNTTVFPSVVNAWKGALETMEKLISGMPQAVQDGAVILGLSSWHIYPDIAVFGSRNVEVHMADDLVKTGGVLSLGLSKSGNTPGQGVYWCLSLANLRHYGRPVRTERHLRDDPTRITFMQLIQASLGAIIGLWHVPTSKTSLSMKFFVALCEVIQDGANSDKMYWAPMLMQSASAYLSAISEEKDIAERLVQLGRRRSTKFIAKELSSNGAISERPYFGLIDPSPILECLKGPEERIQFLRRMASKIHGLRKETIILRYSYEPFDSDQRKPDKDVGGVEAPQKFVRDQFDKDCSNDEETCGFGHEDQMNESGLDGQVYKALSDDEMDEDEMDEDETDGDETDEDEMDEDDMAFPNTDTYSKVLGPFTKESQSPVEKEEQYSPTNKKRQCAFATAFPGWNDNLYSGLDQNLALHDPDHFSHHRWFLSDSLHFQTPAHERERDLNMDLQTTGSKMIVDGVVMTEIFGDSEMASIFVQHTKETEENLTPPRIEAEDILWCFESGFFPAEMLLDRLSGILRPVFRTIFALGLVSRIYCQLPDAMIAVGVLDRPLLRAKWSTDCNLDSAQRKELLQIQYNLTRYSTWAMSSRSWALAIVAYMDSVYCDVSRSDLQTLSQFRLANQYTLRCSYELKRILGNVGKPGVVMLTLPPEPMVRDLDSRRWTSAIYADFNGEVEDYFDRTSLHLSFTNYHVPMFDKAVRGGHDTQISVLESIISVRDSGVWVADVDVIKALE